MCRRLFFRYLLIIAGILSIGLIISPLVSNAKEYTDILASYNWDKSMPVSYLNSGSKIWNAPKGTKKGARITNSMSKYRYRTFKGNHEDVIRGGGHWLFVHYKNVSGWVSLATVRQDYALGSVERRSHLRKLLSTYYYQHDKEKDQTKEIMQEMANRIDNYLWELKYEGLSISDAGIMPEEAEMLVQQYNYANRDNQVTATEFNPLW